VNQPVYLDNNATTQTAPEVVEAMRPFFHDLYGNASSMHSFGGQVKQHVERAREQVAALIGADPGEIVFTSCGTESDNTAIHATLEAFEGRKRHIITSRVEHLAVLSVCRYHGAHGCRVTELPVDREGLLDLEQLNDAITSDTAVVSLMWANNETGVLFPMEEIADICRRKDVVLHTDAVQAVGKIPVDMSRVPVDMLSLSGHKLHTPKGIGVLYVRKGTRFSPLMYGGHQEGGKRPGTENVPYIVGLGRAAELARERMAEENERVRALRDRLEERVLANCPDAKLNGHKTKRLPNTANISFEYIEGEAILLMLDALGICASSGSACTSGSLDPSHVMRAMGVPFTAAHGSIRFSLSVYNTEAEVDYVVEHMPGIVNRLRELSPFVPAS
jgi:cysteine desulfurase